MRRITGSELLPYVHNCLRAELDEKDRVRFFRFADRQFQEYKKNPFFAARAILPAGVKLEFYTDSMHLVLSWDLVKNGPWKTESVVDMYIDGVFVKEVPFSEELEPTVCLSVELPIGMKRITFWFNKTFDVALRELSVEANAVLQPVPIYNKYLALGDSITFSSAQHPSLGYAMQVAEHFNWELYNQGVGGYYYDANSLDPELPLTPDIITVAYGTNDNRSDRQAYRNRVGNYLERLISIWPDIPVFVITPLWRLDLNGKESFDWIYPVIEEECSRFPQITVIDGRTAMPRLPEFYSDGYLHPNDFGMTCYANIIIQAIEASGRIG